MRVLIPIAVPIRLFKVLETIIVGREMSSKTSITGVNEYQRYVCSVVPPLDFNSHKGQSGRLGVIGGSDIFTGAPYYVGMAALRLGADLVYVVTTKDAAPVIKSYSPELMVLPYLNVKDVELCAEMVLPRIHALVIGPGLGTDLETQEVVTILIRRTIEMQKPIILDASVFPLICNNLDLIRGYPHAILTPNAHEFKLLYEKAVKTEFSSVTPETVEQLALALGNVTILVKGPVDIMSNGITLSISDEHGSPRRCGGQGDVLAGLLGTFTSWAYQAKVNETFARGCPHSPSMVASLGASMVTRRCARMAFRRMRRSTLTTDMLEEIRDSFTALFPVD